jgi:hypothetical protein
MRGWFLIFQEVEVGRIGAYVDVGEEGSEQTIITLQSLHGSVGYQHARTRVGLAKEAYPFKCNREHKQE